MNTSPIPLTPLGAEPASFALEEAPLKFEPVITYTKVDSEAGLDTPVWTVASPIHRLLAVLLDLIVGLAAVLTTIVMPIRLDFPGVQLLRLQWLNPWSIRLTGFTVNPTMMLIINSVLLGFIFYAVYYTILMSLSGQTVGKYLANIKVVRDQGERLRFSDVCVRLVTHVFLSPFSLGVSYWSLYRHPLGKSWHDYVSGTIVIKDH